MRQAMLPSVDPGPQERRNDTIMRSSLSDLIIGIVTGSLGGIAGATLARLAGLEHLLLFMFWAFAIPAHFVITPLIYRRFHLRPMLVPRCPRCKDRNRWFYYEKRKPDWPRDVIICSVCKNALELWYELPQDAHVSETMPSFRLVWPQSWGRWRIISSGDSK